MRPRHPWHITLILAAALSGCATTSRVYEDYGDKMDKAGDPGQAMAAYQAQLDQDPDNAKVRLKWQRASAAWIKEQAAKGPTTAKERFAHINALMALAKARKIEDQVGDALLGPLDKVIGQLWGGESLKPSTAAYWRAVKEAYGWVANLPAASAPHQKYEALRKEAAAYHAAQAKKLAGHVPAAFFHATLAAWYGGAKVQAEVEAAFHSLSRGNYELKLSGEADCGPMLAAMRKKIAAMPALFPGQTGYPVSFDVQLKCMAVKESWQTHKPNKWTEEVVTSQQAMEVCGRSRWVQKQKRMGGGGTYSGYITVPVKVRECETKIFQTKKLEQREGMVVTTHERIGVEVEGEALIASGSDKVAYPLTVMSTIENIRWQGPKGSGERLGKVSQNLDVMAHSLWGQLWRARYTAQIQRAAAALGRAAAASTEDEAAGEHVVSGLLPHEFNKRSLDFFKAKYSIGPQELKALFLGGPRPAPKAPVGADYKLELPRLDAGVRSQAEQATQESGEDGY